MTSVRFKDTIENPIVLRRLGWLELLLIIVVLIAFFTKDIQSIDFHGDESQWISTSYFIGPFVRAEFSSPVWDVSYWTLTQPPLARYIIGIARWLGGFHAKDLNSTWRFGLTHQENMARGAMPSAELLWWSRLPMAILAALSAALLFFLASKAAGRISGYAVLLLFVLNDYLATVLLRAMGDSPLLVFILLAAVAGYRALTIWQHPDADWLTGRKTLCRSLMAFGAMGLFCGLAAGAKLSGMSVLLAGFGLCVLLGFAGNQFSHRKYDAALAACVLVVSTIVTFVALNPFLYPKPLDRTKMMVQHRFDEMSAQQEAWPGSSIDRTRRFSLIQQRVLEDYATLRFSGAQTPNLLLSIIGMTYLLYTSWRWVQKRTRSGAAIVILLVAFTAATPSMFTPIDWERYYLLPVVFSTLFIAIAISWGVRLALFPLWPRWAGLFGRLNA